MTLMFWDIAPTWTFAPWLSLTIHSAQSQTWHWGESFQRCSHFIPGAKTVEGRLCVWGGGGTGRGGGCVLLLLQQLTSHVVFFPLDDRRTSLPGSPPWRQESGAAGAGSLSVPSMCCSFFTCVSSTLHFIFYTSDLNSNPVCLCELCSPSCCPETC